MSFEYTRISKDLAHHIDAAMRVKISHRCRFVVAYCYDNTHFLPRQNRRVRKVVQQRGAIVLQHSNNGKFNRPRIIYVRSL